MHSSFNVENWLDAFELTELSRSLANAEKKETDEQYQFAGLWQNHEAFRQDPTLFTARLKTEGLSHQVLAALQANDLAFNVEQLDKGWINNLQAAYESSVNEGASLLGSHKLTLLSAIRFLIEWSLDELLDELIVASQSFASYKDIISLFIPMLLKRLANLVNRSVVLEMHIEKHKGQLQGESSEQRFEHFIKGFADRQKQLDFLREYPLLAKKVLTLLRQWQDTVLEFCQRMEKDSSQLCIEYQVSSIALENISHIQGGMSDPHNGGRNVLIVTFQNEFKLVYKPRDLTMDLHFYQLLDWLNQRSADLSFKTLKIVNHRHYGWSEYVENSHCNSQQQLNTYYQRVGGLLALLYMLEASDMHFENLIACGEHPVIIDLETLFQGAGTPQSKGIQEFTVLSTGLLPTRMHSPLMQRDTSAIAGSGGATVKGVSWQHSYTDKMQFARSSVKLQESGDNLPERGLNQSSVVVLEAAIIQGFLHIYQVLEQHKASFLANDGIINKFSNIRARYVLRNTGIYSDLLRDLGHPENLISSLNEAHRLDYLYLNQMKDDLLHQVVLHEKEALKAGDIPHFSVDLNARDLESTYGKPIKNFVSDTPINSVKQRIKAIGKDDLQKQTLLIDASLKAFAKNHGVTKSQIKPQQMTALFDTNNGAVDDLVFHYLQLMRVTHKDTSTWFHVSFQSGKWAVAAINNNWFEGQVGVSLFLAYYAQRHNHKAAWRLAEKSVNFCLEHLQEELQRENTPETSDQPLSPGLFDGISGVLYLLSHMQCLRAHSAYLNGANQIKTWLKNKIEDDHNLDVISGVAGVLQACLSAQTAFKDEHFLQLALLCGERLLQTAEQHDNGLSWTIQGEVRPLAGYSHGAAGICHALIALYKNTRQAKFLDAAKRGIAFENTLFQQASSNWLDQRSCLPASTINRNSFWSHGGAGILLSRLALLEVQEISTELKNQLISDIKSAIRSIVNQGFEFNHSLCNGVIGNLVILKKAMSVMPDTATQSLIEQHLHRLQKQINGIEQLQCRTPLETLDPGFMLGASGIGWGYLYLKSEAEIPCLISAEPAFSTQPFFTQHCSTADASVEANPKSVTTKEK